MKLDEVPPVLDVHPPHEPMHGWRDFLLNALDAAAKKFLTARLSRT